MKANGHDGETPAVRYVTSNDGKVREAREYLGEVERSTYDYTEIQSDSLSEIAAHGAREAHDALGVPVVTDDAGLFVRALGGFPGPYSSYVENTVGVDRVWSLVEAESNRRGSFQVALAYADDRTREHEPNGVQVFEGRVDGTLVAPRGDGGFGYDPVFEFDGTTLAEMDSKEKNAISHRGRALEKFADWMAENRQPER
jgi:XTP/dITP diphosphohydrolase